MIINIMKYDVGSRVKELESAMIYHQKEIEALQLELDHKNSIVVEQQRRLDSSGNGPHEKNLTVRIVEKQHSITLHYWLIYPLSFIHSLSLCLSFNLEGVIAEAIND